MCSSFVLNTSLVAMVRLDDRLKEVCNTNLADQEVPLPADYRFLNLPIRSSRVLDFVMPHQLARRGLAVASELKKPEIIQQILNCNEYEMK